MKKATPYLLLVLFFVLALIVRQCREGTSSHTESTNTQSKDGEKPTRSENILRRFRNPEEEYFFTKHARCRMECRRITQKEVKEIVRKVEVNYNKSDFNDPKIGGLHRAGPTACAHHCGT